MTRFALIESAKRFHAAALRRIGARTQQRNRHAPGVDFVLDVRTAYGPAMDALRVEPGVEACPLKRSFQVLL